MRLIQRAIALVAIFVFTSVASVSSEALLHKWRGAIAQEFEGCFIVNSAGTRVDLTRLCTGLPEGIILFSPRPTPTASFKTPDAERFLKAIENKLQIIPQLGTFEYILLREYGAVFLSQDPRIKLPRRVIFQNEQETKEFQSTLTMGQVNGTNCYLQKPAADALNKVRSQVQLPLKSGSGSGDCTRSFSTHLRFWRKYANNQILERVRQGKNTAILSIVAPPGSSQHLLGLAVDLRVSNQAQRKVLEKNGWFQTVFNDIPHWSYVGFSEENLLQFGLKNKIVRGTSYWVTPL